MAVAGEHASVAAYSAYPAVVFIYFVVSSILLCLRPGKASGRGRDVRTLSRRGPVMAVLGILVTVSAVNALVLTLLSSNPVFATSTEYAVAGQLSCALVFGIQLTYIHDFKRPLWHPFQGSWVIALLFEVLLQCLVFSQSASGDRTPASDITSAAFAGMKCLLLVTLVLLTMPPPRIFGRSAIANTECQPLLGDNQQMMEVTGDQGGTDPVTYGSMSDFAMGHSDRGNEEASHLSSEEVMQAAEDIRTATGKGSRFADGLMVRLLNRATASTDTPAFSDRLSVTYGDVQALTDVQVVLPYIWPVGLRKLHLRLVGILLCLLTTSACNVLIPRQVGIIIDILITQGAGNVWIAVALLVTMRLAVSASGLETLCQWLWSPISSYMTESMTRAVYSRMMHLSADFHESWSTSQMFLAIHGASAMSSLASCLLLGGFPMLIDIIMAGSYISLTLGFFEGLITATSGIIFFLLTSRFVTKAARANRPRKLLLQKEHSLQQHGLMTWHDSSVLNQLGFEDNRHSDCVTARHVEEKRYAMAWAKSTAARTLILAAGLLATAFCAVHRVRTRQATPGQGAMLLAYWFQLSVSLAYMASLGIRVTDDLEDAEKVVEVMNFRLTYGNQKSARPLKFAGGSIQFNQVSFRYNSQKPFIHDFSLKIQAAQTVLVVGPSGAGKSTLLKLICRLRDATGGTIRVNDQDVRDVDVSSLRDRIGVVPQAPVLFDDSIMNNVRYGRITASDEEVYEACKAACIHHRINEFVEGYNTRVGHRGMKLSAGEVQLLAIARVLLRKPNVLLLDEPTSALDNHTTEQLRNSLITGFKGITTVLFSHDPRALPHASLVVVLEGGQIVEQGSHDDLIRTGGTFAKLWNNTESLHGTVGVPLTIRKSPKLIKEPNEPTKGLNVQDVVISTGMLIASSPTQQITSTKKEVSKLNPVAAAFTPRQTRTGFTIAKGTSTSEDTNTDSQSRLPSSQTSRQWSDEVTAEEERMKLACTVQLEEPITLTPSKAEAMKHQVSNTPTDKAKASRTGTNMEAVDRTEAVSNENIHPERMGKIEFKQVPNTVSSLEKVQFKRPRYSRRIQSKSEPCHETEEPQTVHVENPSHETSADEISSAQQQQHRRVSAPAPKPAQQKSKIARPPKGKKSMEMQHPPGLESKAIVSVSRPPQATKISSKSDAKRDADKALVNKTPANDQNAEKTSRVIQRSDEHLIPSDNCPLDSALSGQGHHSEDSRGGRRGRPYHRYRRRGPRKVS